MKKFLIDDFLVVLATRMTVANYYRIWASNIRQTPATWTERLFWDSDGSPRQTEDVYKQIISMVGDDPESIIDIATHYPVVVIDSNSGERWSGRLRRYQNSGMFYLKNGVEFSSADVISASADVNTIKEFGAVCITISKQRVDTCVYWDWNTTEAY